MVLAKLLTDEIIASEYTELFTTGYPRSGNTWTGILLADVLDSPLQEKVGNPIHFHGFSEEGKYVIRKAHALGQFPCPAVYVYRDPRDICVSGYFYFQRPSMNYAICQMAGVLPEQEKKKNRAYERWHRTMKEHKEYCTIAVRYEDLLKTPIETLWGVVYALTGLELTESRIAETVERQSFDALLERFPDPEHFVRAVMRKGIVGDWKNHFKRDDGRLFQEHFGRIMLDQGYIKDGDWWEELPV